MVEDRKREDIQAELRQLELQELQLEEDIKQFARISEEVLDLHRRSYAPFRELEYYPLTMREETERLEELAILERNEQMFDNYVVDRQASYQKEKRQLDERVEELLYEYRRLEVREEEKHGN